MGSVLGNQSQSLHPTLLNRANSNVSCTIFKLVFRWKWKRETFVLYFFFMQLVGLKEFGSYYWLIFMSLHVCKEIMFVRRISELALWRKKMKNTKYDKLKIAWELGLNSIKCAGKNRMVMWKCESTSFWCFVHISFQKHQESYLFEIKIWTCLVFFTTELEPVALHWCLHKIFWHKLFDNPDISPISFFTEQNFLVKNELLQLFPYNLLFEKWIWSNCLLWFKSYGKNLDPSHLLTRNYSIQFGCRCVTQ